MAQRSRFFDSSGGDRIYTSDAWAQVLGAIIGDGVVASGNELAVAEASPPAMSVRVNTGKAFIGGYYFEVHTGQETLAIGAAHATLPRIDRVVVRRDLAGRTAALAVLAGTPADTPTAPALTQVAAGVWEISLASVAVAAAAASIVDANITDERGPRAKGTDIENLQTTLLDPTTGHRHEGTAGTGRAVRHADLGGLTSDNHHAKSHTHSGDGSGSVTHAATTGQSATDHHAAPVAGPDANVTVDAAGAAGTAGAFARSAHGHQVASSSATPASVAAAGSAGADRRAGPSGARPRARLGLPARRPPPASPRAQFAHWHRRRHQRLGAGVGGRRRGRGQDLGGHDRPGRLGRRGRRVGEEVSREA